MVGTTFRNRLKRSTPALLAGLLLLSFALRLHRLAGKSVWWDEGLAAWAARQSLLDISRWTSADVHPGLYFYLLKYWHTAVGDLEFTLRYPSVLIGVVTVAAVYTLGRRVGGLYTGLLAALLLAVSRFGITWSQEMRMYGLAALLATFAMWAAIRVWDEGLGRDWLAYIFFMTAGLYTLYLSVMVLVVANLAWLLWVLPRARLNGRELIRWSSAQGAVLLLFFPWLAYALGRIPTWTSASPIAFRDFLVIYWTVLTTGIPIDVTDYAAFTLPVLLVFLAGVGLLLWQTRRHWRVQRNIALFLLGLVLPAVVVFLVSLPKETFFYAPQFAPRYLIMFLAAYAIMMAWGIVTLGQKYRFAGVLAAVVVVVVALVGLDGYYQDRVPQDDYRSLVNTLESYRRPEDAVVLLTDKDWPVFAYYYKDRWHGVSVLKTTSPERVDEFLSPLWEEHAGIWLLTIPDGVRVDPDALYAGWLEEHAAGQVAYEFGDKTLAFYAHRPQRAEVMAQPAQLVGQSLSVDGPGQLELYGYSLPAQLYEAGGIMRPVLYWRGSGTAEPTLRVVDESGQTWQQQPAEVALDGSGPLRQLYRLWIPPEAPSGAYRLTVQMGEMAPETVAGFRVQAQERVRLVPEDVQIEQPTNYNFENGARLLGFDLPEKAVQAGEEVPLTLYWQATRPLEERYKVFAHLVAPDGARRGQQDNEPVQGTLPMTVWQPGEVVVDRYAIPVDPETPPGEYWIHVGLYHPLNGERVTVADGELVIGAHVELAPVEVTRAGGG